MANKNTFLRLQKLDELLSNTGNAYNVEALTEEVNKYLAENGHDQRGICKRTIEKDLKFISEELGYELKRTYIPKTGNTNDDEKRNKKGEKKDNSTIRCIRYATPGFAIFQKKLSKEEKILLKGAFSIIGQFDGLPKFERLDQLLAELKADSDFTEDKNSKIISFTKSQVHNSNMIGRLFNYIKEKQVLEIKYHDHFNEDYSIKTAHPYLLKEYNGRWYLIAGVEQSNKEAPIRHLALDRIESIRTTDRKYIKYSRDILKRFEHIIGVTVLPKEIVKDIVFWVGPEKLDYILTKPIHHSQTQLDAARERTLYRNHPGLREGGHFFKIKCKRNYELIRELTAYGSDLIVVSPKEIAQETYERVASMTKAYEMLRLVK